MNVREYKDKVIELFQSGEATNEQWEEMAEAILFVSQLKVILPDQTSFLWEIDDIVECGERENSMELDH